MRNDLTAHGPPTPAMPAPRNSAHPLLGSDPLPKVEQERLRAKVAARLFGGASEPLRIGRYTILKRLGAGGNGIVYSAYDPELDRKVALKLLKNPQRGASSSLQTEARALAQLSHPNVVDVFEVGRFHTQCYLAMEYLPGVPLDQAAPQREAPLDSRLRPWIEVAQGLDAIHAHGLIHGDFKPANVMQLPDGRVKIFDFGLAWRPDGPQHRSRGGTPAYMAPEQRSGGPVDARADQYSYCVALWNFCTLHPFNSNIEDIDDLPRPDAMPRWLHRILKKGLQTDPNNRYPDMRGLQEALEVGLRRPKHLKYAGGLVVLAGAMALSWSAWSTRPDPCMAVSERWSQTRASLEDLDITPSLRRQVHLRLARYAQRADRAHTELCRRATPNRPRDAAAFAVQSTCFFAAADALDQLRARVEMTPDEAYKLARWLKTPLPSLHACQTRSAEPNSEIRPETRTRIEQALAKAQVQLALQDYPHARRQAQEVLSLSSTKHLARERAQAHLIIARALNVDGDSESAQEQVNFAYRLAQGIADDDLRLDALVLRAKIFTVQGKHRQAAAQMQDAHPLARRPSIATRRRVEYFSKACRIDRRHGALCPAIERCREGLKLLSESQSAPIALNAMQRRLAFANYEAGRVDRALALAKKADRDLRRAQGHPSDSVVTLPGDALLITLGAETRRMQDAPSPAWSAFASRVRTVLQREQSAYGKQSPYTFAMQATLAEVLRRAGELDKARARFESLLEQQGSAAKKDHYSQTMLGQLLLDLGQKSSAIATLRLAISTMEAANRSKPGPNAFPELPFAHFALARALGPKQTGLEHANVALKQYYQLEAQSRQDALRCFGRADARARFASERQAVQTWIHRHAPPGSNEMAPLAPSQKTQTRR